MASFFGFDPSVPRNQPHNQSAHGFGQAPDAFAGLSRDQAEDDGELNFEDTYEGYDGLGDQLQETGDDLNQDTFGSGPVGRDFDFSGQSVQTTSRFPQQQQQQQQFPPSQQPRQMQMRPPSPPPPSTRPARSGYERYKEADYIPRMEASASIWGSQPQRPSSSTPQQQMQENQTSISNVTKSMMSLEELEATMRANARKPSPAPTPQQYPQQPPPQEQPPTRGPQILQRHQVPPKSQSPLHRSAPSNGYIHPDPANGAGTRAPQVIQRRQPMYTPSHEELMLNHQRHQASPQQQQQQQQTGTPQPTPTPQDPQMATMHSRNSTSYQAQPPSQQESQHGRGPSFNGRPVTHPDQVMQMPEDQRAAFIEEDAKRAKRNHKIHMLSKDNGLMTPQDKNFITRIQLSQLLTATGNVEEQGGPEIALAEDFYYQVFSQIRGHRNNQPLNQFAQTYLHQTGGRTGGRRGYVRGGDQIRRMEQQVQRAVEAAKQKPKNKQLVLEGSLGKISFSNAKTPKPLLNIKRADAQEKRPDSAARQRAPDTASSRRAILRDIESLYTTLMSMEDHERRMPPPTTEESSADEIQEQINWRARIQELNAALWGQLKVLEPIDPNKSSTHPFISILSHPKGKKIMPRIFRQIDDQQRLTILTMIVIHLDSLDVVRLAQARSNEEQLPIGVRHEIDLFSQAVMPMLFNYINDTSLGHIVGLLGLVTGRVNIPTVVRSKIGLGLLTMFLSRAELLRHAGNVEPEDQQQFSGLYNQFFDLLEPTLPTIFTTPIKEGDDMYIWQFLAAVGTGASPDQQPRLVIGVKDRVMDTVSQAKEMPEDAGKQRLDNVNLFMRAIGLDVELLG